MYKKFVGAHVSASGGVSNAPINAQKIGAKAFALFTKNQKQWNAKPLEQSEIESFKSNLKIANIDPKYVLPHDSYLINIGSPDKEKLDKSLSAFIDEIHRCEALGLDKLNFHPGSHLKLISEDECIKVVANSINIALKESNVVKLVIENTAGQGGNIGYKLEHLRDIIDLVEYKNRIGVCIDTCHLFVSGYDIRDENCFMNTFSLFEKIVGFEFLSGMHINDSKTKFSSKVDRHENIGKGEIGIEAFKLIMNDDRFNDIPLILETTDDTLWEEEIKTLYSFCFNDLGHIQN